MGSTGTGNFSDYSENQKENKGENSSGSHETGGRSGSDKCLRAFTTKLEEVANSDYLVFVFKLKMLINTGGCKHSSKKFRVSWNQR